MEPTPTIWSRLADWFESRRPTAIVADGICLLMWSGFVYLLWILWYQVASTWIINASDGGRKFIGGVLSSLHSGLFYFALVIIAVGCARIIAEGPRPRTPPTSDTTPPAL